MGQYFYLRGWWWVLAVCVIFSPQGMGQPSQLLAKLERSACYGFCPAYAIEIATDGTVTYDGRSFVVTQGQAVGRLGSNQIRRLREAFERARFRDLADDCCNCYELTDQRTVKITLVDGQAAKEIQDYHGCSKTPAALRSMEDEIDAIVNVEQWIGTREQRSRLRFSR